MFYREEYEQVAALHEVHPIFVSREFATETIIPCSISVIVGVSFIYAAVSLWVIRLLLPNSSTFTHRNAAYQCTNLMVNAIIGTTGLYYFMFKMPAFVTLEDKVVGLEELYPFACMQLGYQLWALPVGIFWIKESIPMLGHHLAVIATASMAAFCSMGFRYFTPLMFGMMELSSVPLAIMNAFKDNPELIQKYPSTYFASRVAFAMSFLMIRWYMVFPPMFEFLRLLGYATFSYQSKPLYLFHVVVWTLAHFLALLQIFWGSLIIKATIGVIFGKRKEKAS